MCQSKANGGRRCPTANSRTRISSQANLSEEEKQQKINKLNKASEKYGPCVYTLDIPTPPEVKKVIDLLSDKGNPLIVGGTVRDAIMGVTPKDFDIEVHEMEIDEIVKVLKKSKYRVDEVGKSFGVLKVQAGEEELDISVPRKDSLTGVGHKGFTVEQDPNMGVEEAASRRDYTFNSIMYDSAYGTAVDPYNGIQDLKNKKLRHVSEAFSEDPLRPLRGVQFAARYDLTIDDETAELSKTLRGQYSELATERVQVEWMKFYTKGNNLNKGLDTLKKIGWHDTIKDYDTINHSAVAKLKKQDSVEIKASVIAKNMSDENKKAFFRTTVLGEKLQKRSYHLATVKEPKTLTREELRRWSRDEIYRNRITAREWLQVQEAHGFKIENLKNKLDELNLTDNPPEETISGKDILEIYPDEKPGKWVGALMTESRKHEDKKPFLNKEEAIKWLRNKRASQIK